MYAGMVAVIIQGKPKNNEIFFLEKFNKIQITFNGPI